MPTIVDRVRSAFSLNSNDTLHKQASDLRKQSLEIWRKAVAQAAAGKPIALLELQAVALNLGITPGRLPSALEGDIAAWKAERELRADVERSEIQAKEAYVIAEAAQKELEAITNKLGDLRWKAAGGAGAGMTLGVARNAHESHRQGNPRLWDDLRQLDVKQAEAQLEVPREDTPPSVVVAKQADTGEAEWLVDAKD